LRYDTNIGRAQSFSEIYAKGENGMVYNETCSSCGNTVTITVDEDSPAVSGGSSYTIKCSKCGNEVRTISSRSMPRVTGGYAEKDPY